MGAAGPYWVTAHPVSWPPYEWPVGDDRQISSQDQRSVKLRVRPPLTGTHRCHEATPTGRGIMLTVKLTQKLVHRPPRYCARVRRELAMLGIRNGC